MGEEQNPTARALVALELIQRSPGITAQRLADALDVTERAARRYVATLRAADIPIVATRGPYGGYRVGRGVRPPPMVFSADEALALVMALLDGHHDVADPDAPVGTALGKILRSLPSGVAASAEAVRSGVSPAPDTGSARPDPATATALVEASTAHRSVRLEYRSESGRTWHTDVDPWAVVVRHGRWYLLCHAHHADARRAYRVDRVLDVEVLDATFVPPDDLDPVAELEAHLAVGWEFSVEVVIDAPVHRARAWVPRTIGRLEAVDGSSCRLVATTSNPYWYAERLAALPVPFRVIGGPELLATVRSLGRRMISATSGATGATDSADPSSAANASTPPTAGRDGGPSGPSTPAGVHRAGPDDVTPATAT
ncbi:WYL domain-containing protein [Cellulomonas sp.]|uniref:helix-turn-helix transcriptional regulator n=1 Tax=Cellulomonas sp. TaxID=40001 RepID=UPI001B1C1B9D|nr:WYL domain-containing protein [Cellulomonas sp.]MBO9553484.1 WYL domain-containing protein [Cellulomonas sp.]